MRTKIAPALTGYVMSSTTYLMRSEEREACAAELRALLNEIRMWRAYGHAVYTDRAGQIQRARERTDRVSATGAR